MKMNKVYHMMVRAYWSNWSEDDANSDAGILDCLDMLENEPELPDCDADCRDGLIDLVLTVMMDLMMNRSRHTNVLDS